MVLCLENIEQLKTTIQSTHTLNPDFPVVEKCSICPVIRVAEKKVHPKDQSDQSKVEFDIGAARTSLVNCQ